MLQTIDHIEMYVGNIVQASYFYQKALGFIKSSHVFNNTASIQLEQNHINLILTSSSNPNSTISKHLNKHGDGIKKIGFVVKDVNEAYNSAIKNGATSVLAPSYTQTENGSSCKAEVLTFGNIVHSFHNQHSTTSQSCNREKNNANHFLLEKIDHLAICLNKGELDKWIDFYCNAFGFSLSHEETVDTGKSGMNSKAIEFGDIKLVFTEPMDKYVHSQIQEYLDAYQGPGIQHVAYATSDIVKTIKVLVNQGIEFLNIPENYYELRKAEFPDLAELINSLRSTKILIDRDEHGILLQTFSKPLQSSPTFFIEIIQRLNSKGFGSGNINALFKAVEMEQLNRGKV
ncbi:MAG: 4-hydroxyphenylpyruvate dioxygenase [Legionellaceae bacterium]